MTAEIERTKQIKDPLRPSAGLDPVEISSKQTEFTIPSAQRGLSLSEEKVAKPIAQLQKEGSPVYQVRYASRLMEIV